MQETQIRSLGREDPLEKEMATHSSILVLPGEFHRQRRQAGTVPGIQRVNDWAINFRFSYVHHIFFIHLSMGI